MELHGVLEGLIGFNKTPSYNGKIFCILASEYMTNPARAPTGAEVYAGCYVLEHVDS